MNVNKKNEKCFMYRENGNGVMMNETLEFLIGIDVLYCSLWCRANNLKLKKQKINMNFICCVV